MELLRCFLTENDCYRAGESFRPKGVMVHSTASDNTRLRRYVQPTPGDPNYQRLMAALGTNRYGNHWNKPGVNKCVHAFVGRLADGTVAAVQTLPWDMRGWHSGHGFAWESANDYYIGFEICEDDLTDPVYFDGVYRTAVSLTAMLCGSFGLDPLGENVVIDHHEGYRLGLASNHGDVAHWFPRFGKTMDDFRADVAREMEGDMEYQQFKTYMARYRGELQAADGSPWSGEDRAWAVEQGIFQGTGGDEGSYMWQDFLTREQAAAILRRMTEE